MLQLEIKTIEKIIDIYSNMIYRICFVYLKNQHDAEDAYQDVAIKIMEKAPPFLNDNHEKAWIIKVTCNHCKNILRLSKLRKQAPLIDDIHAISNEDEQNTLEHIMNLPLQYRKVLYLYYYEGYSTKEIASILKRRDATIRTWLKRARETLKKIMGDDYEK